MGVKYKMVVFDIDGTIFYNGKLNSNARELIKFLVEKNIAIKFYTNSSSKSKQRQLERFMKCGITNIRLSDIYTSIDSIVMNKLEFKDKIIVVNSQDDCITKELRRNGLRCLNWNESNDTEKVDFYIQGSNQLFKFAYSI